MAPSRPTVAKLRSRADSAMATTGVACGSKTWAFTIADSFPEPTGAFNHPVRTPSAAPATQEFPPSIHSSAVMGSALTCEMSARRGSGMRTQ